MRSAIAMGLFVLSAMACAESRQERAPEDDVDDEASEGAEISAWAGGVVSYGNEVRLHVPAGSMERDARIAIARLASVPAIARVADGGGGGDGFLPSGQGYELTPHGTAFALARPAKISIEVEVAALTARGLDPRTAQLFHYDEEARRYVNVAGALEGQALVASLEHFSKYVVMAQAAALGDPGPAIAMQTPVPNPIRTGAPIYLRATVLPAPGTSIAAVRVHYRKLHPAGQPYTVAVMSPDSSPATPGTNTYGALVPGAWLGAGDLGVGADLEYFAEATDTLGVTRTLAAAPVTVDLLHHHEPSSLMLLPAVVDIAAGFEHWLPLMARDFAGTSYQIIPETVSVSSCPGSGQPALGEVEDQRASGIRFRARTVCAGTLSATASGETVTVPVRVRTGHLAAIELYRYERLGGTEVRTRLEGTYAVREGEVIELDALGVDGFGNTMHVNVTWQADASVGTIDGEGRLYTLDGAGSGRVTASVGGLGGARAVQWFQVTGRSWRGKGAAIDRGSSAPWVALPLESLGYSPHDTAIRLHDDRVLFLSRNVSQLFHPGQANWSPASPRYLPRIYATASLLSDGRVLLTGGIVTPQSELFDPTSRTWSEAAPMLRQRSSHQQVTMLDGRVLVMGGFESGSSGAGVESYDPVLNRWTARASMHTHRVDHAVTLLAGGRVLVSGGTTRAGMESSAEVYDPVTDTWSLTTAMSSPRRLHAQVLLPDGKVLAVGGAAAAALASAEIYDPATNLWTSVAPMSMALSEPSVAVLPNGQVLVAGGLNGSTWQAAVSLFDPHTGTWTAKPPMLTALQSPHAIPLSSGRVLVISSGSSSSEVYLSSQPAPRPSLAAAGSELYVAWHEPSPTSNRVRVKRWLGDAWAEVGAGGLGAPGREASHPSLALNPMTGQPSVAWQEQGSAKELRVWRWDGASWSGSAALNVSGGRDAGAPALAFSGPTPYVAWQERGAAAWQIYVRRWNGVEWQQLGGSLNRDPARHATAPALVVEGAIPYVAWQEERAAGSQLFVARWDGAAWTSVGGALNTEALASAIEPSLTLVNGHPLVAWRERTTTAARVQVARWTGAAWDAEGPSLPLGAPAPPAEDGTPWLSSVFGTPYLAMRELAAGAPQLVVKHRSGAGWAQNGGSLNLSGDRSASPSSLVFLGSTPWAAWSEANGVTHSVYVKALE